MRIPEELYQQFRRSMPLACVDLIVVDRGFRVLLLLRKTHPACGEWWFPGGRVLYLETRRQAALRKLREECGIHASSADEIGTYDVMLDDPGKGFTSHGVTTLFVIRANVTADTTLDAQSAARAWRTPERWRQEPLHDFVLAGLSRLEASLG
jgi:ADP-ribose pyrophosphatase YjhB (NUDIX family)